MLNYSQRALSRVFGALADPTRRRILEHLAKGDCRVGDLAKPHAMSLPAISQHLRVLEDAGLVRRRRLGRVHRMRMQAKRLREAESWIGEHRRVWENRLDRLDEYLKELQSKEKHHEQKNRY